MSDDTSISDFVREGVLPFVVELGRRPEPPTVREKERLLRLRDMAETEYAGSRDPLKLSALSIARVAVEFFVSTDRDLKAGERLIGVLRTDLQLVQNLK